MRSIYFSHKADAVSVSCDGHVILVSEGQPSAAFLLTGERLWQDTVPAWGVPAISASGDVYLLEGDRRTLRILSPQGMIVRRIPLPSPASNSPIVDRAGTAYVTAGGQLLAISPESGVEASLALPPGTDVGALALVSEEKIILSVGLTLVCVGNVP
jgi:outer membrane protein assembly factor BamB